MTRKRVSKAAQAALKVTGVTRPGAAQAADVLTRLRELDAAFVAAPENRFAAEMARGKAGALEVLAHLADPDPAVRTDAAEALGVVGDTRALGPLRERLTDDDHEVRTAAAVALIRIGDAQLFPEVVRSLRHEDPRVVIGAAVALGRLGDKRVVPNLVEAFKTEDAEVGAAVAWALGQCGDPAALPWLITAVEQGFAVANACEALGRIGDPRAQPALLEALEYASDDVRAYAARALGLLQHGDTAGSRRAGLMSENKPVLALKGLLKDRSRKVRLCAAISLYELGERLGGEALVDELQR